MSERWLGYEQDDVFVERLMRGERRALAEGLGLDPVEVLTDAQIRAIQLERPRDQHALARCCDGPTFERVWRHVLETLRTGRSSLRRAGDYRPRAVTSEVVPPLALIERASRKVDRSHPHQWNRKPSEVRVVYQRPAKAEPHRVPFLDSWEWRDIRFRALEFYGAVCALCGATRANGVMLNADHVIPRRERPDLALAFSNLQIRCAACNHGKGNRIADYRTHAQREAARRYEKTLGAIYSRKRR